MLKVESSKDVATVIQTAVDNRVAEDNGLNSNSSRSHCVFVGKDNGRDDILDTVYVLHLGEIPKGL